MCDTFIINKGGRQSRGAVCQRRETDTSDDSGTIEPAGGASAACVSGRRGGWSEASGHGGRGRGGEVGHGGLADKGRVRGRVVSKGGGACVVRSRHDHCFT